MACPVSSVLASSSFKGRLQKEQRNFSGFGIDRNGPFERTLVLKNIFSIMRVAAVQAERAGIAEDSSTSVEFFNN
jgi:hypothetical protein